MGKILFETNTATYELERSDQEVLECFGSITGIKVKFKSMSEGLVETISGKDAGSPTKKKPFNSDTVPTKEEIINYIENHLDGYNTSMVLEDFFEYVPKYGESTEQDRLLGMLNARINRARQVVSKEKHGNFELVSRGAAKLYVFKQLTENETPEDVSMDDDNEQNLIEEESNPTKQLMLQQ